MKNGLKRYVAVLLIAMFALTGCSHAKDYYGEWSGASDTWGDFEMTFNEDGTAEVTLIGMESKGIWRENEEEKNVTVTTDDFEDINVTAKDEQLTFEFSGETITLKKAE